jgi:S1-C subfamily serine protease
MVPPPAPGGADTGDGSSADSGSLNGAGTTASGTTTATDGVAATSSPPALNVPVSSGDQEDPYAAPPGTTIISPSGASSSAEQGAGPNPELLNYEFNQQMPLNEPQLHSLQEFMAEGVNSSPLGIELQEGERSFHGRDVDGLFVVAVQPDSPASKAGVQAGHRDVHDLIEGAAVAASLVFPPALLAVPVIESVHLGENYDMIIGVDGNRVANFMDFEDQMREAQPGEIVYLNILRSGKRLQVPVKIPAQNASNMYP